jgi:hypothetical protein
MTIRCENCAYWRPAPETKNQAGYCHRYAPGAWGSGYTDIFDHEPVEKGFYSETTWPSTWYYDCCREWKKKKE